MPQSSSERVERATSPAGRSSSRMPSGVSAETTVSSARLPSAGSSGLDDDGIGDLVVEALARLPEDEEHVDQAVEPSKGTRLNSQMTKLRNQMMRLTEAEPSPRTTLISSNFFAIDWLPRIRCGA